MTTTSRKHAGMALRTALASLRNFQQIVDNYRDALTVLRAVLPAVDETKLSEDVRAILPDVSESAPLMTVLEESREALMRQVAQLEALQKGARRG